MERIAIVNGKAGAVVVDEDDVAHAQGVATTPGCPEAPTVTQQCVVGNIGKDAGIGNVQGGAQVAQQIALAPSSFSMTQRRDKDVKRSLQSQWSNSACAIARIMRVSRS